jgi:hypothetical protein
MKICLVEAKILRCSMWTDGLTDGQTDGGTDRQTDRQTDIPDEANSRFLSFAKASEDSPYGIFFRQVSTDKASPGPFRNFS